ncbi:MAG: DUF3800 domain-containing protein [Candidatus Rokuibacteriota bacterium]
MKRTLHVHMDESGDLNFSPVGSRYYVFAATWTYKPLDLALDLQNLRFRLLKDGKSVERFHAASDTVETRMLVLDRLAAQPHWRFAAVVVEKAKVPPADRDPLRKFYSRFASMPLEFVLGGSAVSQAHKVLIYADRLPIGRRHYDDTLKAVKSVCREALPPGLPFHYYHHDSASNAWLQVADYCAWAVFRKWNSRDQTPHKRLRRRLAAPEVDVLAADDVTYYSPSSPDEAP